MKNRGLRNWLWLIMILLGAGAMVLMTFGNHAYAEKNPGGNDFLVHWVGTRAFLLDGISPYGDETALRIQNMVYGRPARAGEHELRVAYPLYSAVVFFPYALIEDFNWARAVWMTVLEVSLILLAVLSMRLARWHPKPVILGVFILFALMWYHAVRPLILGNAVILIALGLAAGLLALRNRQDELAGILFALITIKPQVVVLVLAYIFYWCMVNRRWKVIFWFGGVMLLLVMVSTLLLPDWFRQLLAEVIRYPGYNPPGTLGAALATWFPAIGKRIGYLVSGILALTLLIEWLRSRRMDFRGFYWTVCLTLIASAWIGIQTDPGNFIVLFPALVLVFAGIQGRWKHLASVWNIVTMVVIGVGIWAIFLTTIEHSYQPIQSPILFLPLPAILFIAIYWIRWWAVKPPSTWYEEVAAEGSSWRL